MGIKFITPKKEKEILNTGEYTRVVGIDEAGRGCWAGPVSVGAFVYTMPHKYIKGITDSKLLNFQKRALIYNKLITWDHFIHISDIDSINNLGIGKTVENLISEIVEMFDDGKTFFIIDGQFKRNFGKNTLKVVKADLNYYSVGAASILAKVKRDRIMSKYHKVFPDYGFDRHKGYGTLSHRMALQKYGICELHRKSFKPIKLF